MKVKVNQNTCIGCELCVNIVSEVFKMNDSGCSEAYYYNNSLKNEVEEAINSCPVSAISFEDSISADSIIAEFVEKYPETVEILYECGMHCIGCEASNGESLKDACIIHDLDINTVLEKLNKVVNN